ncbi:MAG: PBP1A family penicillin-binding protein [Armatimonadetes bacterium]|nr:PBP1A family penicillin-binding protein [Armatimonadota bacterium]MDE2207086.1 PBP1A family penicillin-binding protein [Armatimonadota bacterium]
MAVGVVAFLGIFWKFSSNLPSVANLNIDSKPPVATTIWSSDGVLLGSLEVQNRVPVKLAEVPRSVQLATIGIEDHRFYEHKGIDIIGIMRAMWANLRGENLTSQGGSTLTQQLVRHIKQFGVSRQKLYSRKIREALYAIRLEQVYSKAEILQMYLNAVYYGGGAWGIQAAAETYFGKPVYRLDLAEAALLAGLPQRPAAFTPFEHPNAAIQRRNEVLDHMHQYGYITDEEWSQARAEVPHFAPHRAHRNWLSFKAPYFVTYVLNYLTRKYGSDFVYSGLKIQTTLNYRMQVLAQKAFDDGLRRASGYGANQGALVAIDNRTGFIRAMIGGRAFRTSQFNNVTQGMRQPGSAFKLFDYAAAFDTGAATLRTTFVDRPVPYPGDPKHRVVKNYENRYSYHSISCLSAIKFSMNTIAVQVAMRTGIGTTIAYAKNMGITTPLAPVLPTALGASSVRPLDLCSAYSVVADSGSRMLPMALKSVTDASGDVIEEHAPHEITGILQPGTVDQLNTAFEAVVRGGTGTAARGNSSNGIIDQARGKTGTTSDNRDSWFAGYTPELTCVIWLASVHHNSKGSVEYLPMPRATGGDICAPIWHDFMIQALPIEQKWLNTFAAPGAATPVATPKSATNSNAKGADVDTGAANSATSPSGKSSTPGIIVPSDTQTTPFGSVPSPPSPDSGAADATPADTGLAPAPARQPASTSSQSELVPVSICVESGKRATEWCPVVKTVMMSRRRAARLGVCTLHKAPPGE